MGTEKSKVEIALLDTKSDYYAEWALRVEIHLESKDCIGVIQNRRPVPRADVPPEELLAAQLQYDAMDRKARGIITQFLGPYAVNIICALRTVHSTCGKP